MLTTGLTDAAEHTDRVRAVVTFGAPLYRDRAEADEHVARMCRMEALLAGDGPLRDAGWQSALRALNATDSPVTLVAGSADGVPVSGRAGQLARSWPNVGVLTHPTAGHGLPLTDPVWCRQLVAGAVKSAIA